MFDKGLLPQHEFDIPVIVVGNLTVGGAGKTPHTEYIINALSSDYRIGMLSRGYRRQTKGFVLASRKSRPEDIGDEPYQIYRKFENRGIMVAVCEKRVDGIRKMLELNPSLNLIVLDDAFQHRYVKPRIFGFAHRACTSGVQRQAFAAWQIARTRKINGQGGYCSPYKVPGGHEACRLRHI